MEKISWTDRVNNKAVLHTVKEERNILHKIKGRKANWIGHILRRNCLLKHIIEGKIRETRRRGRRRKQLLNDLKEARRYWKLKEEAQDRTLWRTQFGRGYGPVARQTTKVLFMFSHEPSTKILITGNKPNITCKVIDKIIFVLQYIFEPRKTARAQCLWALSRSWFDFP
jgi:hypothetical protein